MSYPSHLSRAQGSPTRRRERIPSQSLAFGPPSPAAGQASAPFRAQNLEPENYYIPGAPWEQAQTVRSQIPPLPRRRDQTGGLGSEIATSLHYPYLSHMGMSAQLYPSRGRIHSLDGTHNYSYQPQEPLNSAEIRENLMPTPNTGVNGQAVPPTMVSHELFAPLAHQM